MENSEKDIALHQHVIRTLLYYDIFNYPLNSYEVHCFLGMRNITEKEVTIALEVLAQKGTIHRVQDYYCIQSGEESVLRRLKGNLMANDCMALAKRQASFIASFPFVRGVLGSGSLSKSYMDEKSDLDFFIVTAPGRLWIARTLLVMYKRLFRFNSHKLFCVNYFVDEDHPQIEEHNVFTATELATVIPFYGLSQYKELIGLNQWLKGYFPNFKERSTDSVPRSGANGLKKWTERLINVLFPDQLEHYFWRITQRRWQRLYGIDYSPHDFELAFRSKKYASKNHPSNYQLRILQLYAQKLTKFGIPSTSIPIHKPVRQATEV